MVAVCLGQSGPAPTSHTLGWNACLLRDLYLALGKNQTDKSYRKQQ